MNMDAKESSDCLSKVKATVEHLKNEEILKLCKHMGIAKGKLVWFELLEELKSSRLVYDETLRKTEGVNKTLKQITASRLLTSYIKRKSQFIMGLIDDFKKIGKLNPSLKLNESENVATPPQNKTRHLNQTNTSSIEEIPPCNLNKEDCLPYHDNDFSASLSSFSEEEILRLVNEYSRSKKLIKKKMEFRKTLDRGTALFALEDVPNKFNYFHIPNEEFIGRKEFLRILEEHKIPEIDFSSAEGGVFTQERLRFIFVIHYHLANLWGSKFFGDIVGLPKYPTFPTLSLPYEAIKLLDTFERKEFLETRKFMKDQYRFYVKKLKESIPYDTFLNIFNGTKLSFANFAYGYSIFQTRTATLNPLKDEPTGRDSVLLPGFHYINTIFEVYRDSTSRGGFFIENDNSVYVSNSGFVKAGDELLNVYGLYNNWKLLMNFGYIPNINEFECVVIRNSTLLYIMRSMKFDSNWLKEKSCFGNYEILDLYIRFNIFNMESGQANECKNKIKQAKITKFDLLLTKYCLPVEIKIGKNIWEGLKREFKRLNKIFADVTSDLSSKRPQFSKYFTSTELYMFDVLTKFYNEKVLLINSMFANMTIIEEVNPSLASTVESDSRQDSAASQANTSEYNGDTSKLIREETCNLNYHNCLPTQDSDFTKILSQYSQKEILDSINKHAKSKKILKKKAEFRWTKKGLGLFALETMPKGVDFLEASENEYIGKNEYYKILKNFGIETFEFVDYEDENNSDSLRFVFTLHYHLANLKKSQFGGDLVGLPKNTNSPIFNIPDTVLNVLPFQDKLNIINLRKKTKAQYSIFVKTIKEKIDPQTLSKLLNGTQISYANFVYCSFIMESRTALINSDIIQRYNYKDIVLVPAYHYANSLDKVPSKESIGYVNQKTVGISTFEEVNPGDELLNYYGAYKNWKYFTSYGYIPKINELECISWENKELMNKVRKVPLRTTANFQLDCLTQEGLYVIYSNLKLNNVENEKSKQLLNNIKETYANDIDLQVIENLIEVKLDIGKNIWDELKKEFKEISDINKQIKATLEIITTSKEHNLTTGELSTCKILIDYYIYKRDLAISLINTMDLLENNPFMLRNRTVNSQKLDKDTDLIKEACDLKDDDCFPITIKSDFTDILSTFSDAEIEESLNEFAKSNGILKKKLVFRNNFNKGKLGLYALEFVDRGSRPLSVSAEDIIGRTEFHKILKKNGISNFDFVATDNNYSLGSDSLSFAFALHYHLANLWESKLFGDLIGLPKLIPLSYFSFSDTLISRLNSYERNDILQRRKNIKSLYLSYRQTIKDHFPNSKNLLNLFNGTQLTFTNFVYCLSIYESRAVLIERGDNNDLKPKEKALVPVIHHINSLDEISLFQKKKKSIYLESGKVHFSNTENIPSGEEVLRNIGDLDNLEYLNKYGIVPNQNDMECIIISNTNLLEKLKKIPKALTLEEADVKCLKKNAIPLIYSNLNLMNMEPHEASDCLSKITGVPDHLKSEKTIKLCLQTLFKKGKTVWKELKSYLNNMKRIQLTFAKDISTSKENNSNEDLPDETQAYDLMIRYYEKKVSLLEFLITETDRMERINGSLSWVDDI